jgi:hypothetical protein
MKRLIFSFGALASAAISTASGATLTGLWLFDNSANPAEATVGSDLVFSGTSPSHSSTLADDAAFLVEFLQRLCKGANGVRR